MAPFVASWGVVGAGNISSLFVQALCSDRPEVTDVVHSIASVASRDITKATEFIERHCPQGTPAQHRGVVKALPLPLGSYQELYQQDSVKIVYIGTLNQTHYEAAKAALEAGKHVLVEKPATLNAAEWSTLCDIAKHNKVFLMESMWTRFLPLAYTLQDKVFNENVIGEIKTIRADFSMAFYNNRADTARNLALEAAGGALLDLGVYCLNLATMLLYHHPVNAQVKPERIETYMVKARTGVDLTTMIIMEYPKLDAVAVLSTSLAYNSPRNALCVIIGTRGQITIHDGLSRITKMTIHTYDEPAMFRISEWKEEVVEQGFPGFGLHFVADATARAVRDGLCEHPRMPHGETLMQMEILDLARRNGNYSLPDGLEKVLQK